MTARIRVAPKEERTADGILFDSRREMQHYLQFRALEKSGAIAKLELQVQFVLWAHSGVLGTTDQIITPVAKYIADFVVTEKDGTRRVYDSKGHKTEIYRLKKKWFEACYPDLRIVEI